jgi:NAD(P)-dependent dehydrogenase (short-subunit alcohol dehydrogenase family)
VGAAVCRALAGEGARVAFTYNANEAAASGLLSSLPGGSSLRLDLRSVAQIESTVARAAADLGGIDAFVNCAAVAVTGPGRGAGSHQTMADVDEDGWGRIMDVNVKSTFFAVRAVADVMRPGGGGNVVLLGSIDGVKPAPAPVHYATSKGALSAMASAMAKELGAAGVRVNLVAPGILEAGLSRDLPQHLRDEYLKHCGLKRVGRLSEVAGIVAWLARHNTYVTGRTILVDGAL